jgi:hypothetical protein
MFDELGEWLGGGWGLGAAIVVGAGLLVGRGGRPMAKKAIQGYLSLSDAARSWSATVVEQAQDLYEESKAELETRAETRAPRASES